MSALETEISIRRHRGFFFWLAVCMLILNLVGFAPSYFLKHWFDARELSLQTHVHGVIFTGWFLVLLAQVSLIAGRDFRRHRQLGSAASVLAALMVISAVLLLYDRAMLHHTAGRDLTGTAFVVWGNLTLLVSFMAFVGLAFWCRRSPASHKRLMILASIAMMPQALGRLGYIPQLRLVDGMLNNVIYAYGGILLLLLALVIHDRVVDGRVHRVTAWGAPTLIGMIAAGTFLLPQTPMGTGLILALG